MPGVLSGVNQRNACCDYARVRPYARPSRSTACERGVENLRDRWGGTKGPSRGCWEITGQYGFIEADRLPGNKPWTQGVVNQVGPCPGWSAGNLMFTLENIDGLYEVQGDRQLSMCWDCLPCEAGCKCVSCLGTPSPPGGPCRGCDP